MKMLVGVTMVALGAGCAPRGLLTETHGRSTQEAFTRQRTNPDAPRGPSPAALQGLDSIEATIIAETYRRSLAPEGEKVEEPQLLMIAPPSRERARPLAPSVPPPTK